MSGACSIEGVRSRVFWFASVAAWMVACSGAPESGLFDKSGGAGGGESNGGVAASTGGISAMAGNAAGGAATSTAGAASGGAASAGAANGGAVNGGAASGGESFGGAQSAFGGAEHGGSAAGGVEPTTGGAQTAFGGAPSAGAASSEGGVSAMGGAQTAGNAGDTAASGAPNGGVANGGAESGGASSGSGGAAGNASGGASGCQKSTEICDGVDNDCNDMIDEKACPSKCIGFVAGDQRYMACATSVNQSAAASTCQKQGMRLAWLDSEAKVTAVLSGLQQIASQGPGSGFVELYIGASDAEQEGHWHWIDGANFWLGNANGSPVDGAYSNWSNNRPNNYPPIPGENCAVSIVNYPSDGEPGQWNDVTCSELHGALCEIP